MQSKATYAIGWTWRPLMLLCGSLFVGLKWMQWIGLPSSTFEETCKTKRYLHSNFFIFVFVFTNQDCILVIQNIKVSNMLCNPKLRWHFRIKCICHLTFIFVFDDITRHFGFEDERQMKFVKRTQYWPCARHFPRFPSCQYLATTFLNWWAFTIYPEMEMGGKCWI